MARYLLAIRGETRVAVAFSLKGSYGAILESVVGAGGSKCRIPGVGWRICWLENFASATESERRGTSRTRAAVCGAPANNPTGHPLRSGERADRILPSRAISGTSLHCKSIRATGIRFRRRAAAAVFGWSGASFLAASGAVAKFLSSATSSRSIVRATNR